MILISFHVTESSKKSTLHVDLFGNYIPGLCSGIGVAIEDLGKPFSREKYPVLTLLAESGIRGLYDMACNHFLQQSCGAEQLDGHSTSFKSLCPFLYSSMAL